MPVMTEAGGATKAQRGYIIGLTRQLNEILGIDSDVVARIERKAKTGVMSMSEAELFISVLKYYVESANRRKK